jgi:MFS transporter, AAHS family, 4-hydroxybenzoate transporter
VLLDSTAAWIGRKAMLVTAAFVFGLFTILTPLADSLPQLVAGRMAAGIRLGGATPCFVALASEYTPSRIGASMISLVWTAFPLGILVGSLQNGYLLTHFLSHSVFHVSGATRIVVGLLLLLLLLTSVGFLLARNLVDPRRSKDRPGRRPQPRAAGQADPSPRRAGRPAHLCQLAGWRAALANALRFGFRCPLHSAPLLL